VREGEELVEAPFQRLIETDQLLGFRHEGFWRPMDTLKDKQVLEDLVEHGHMPWRLGINSLATPPGVRRSAV
jgi:glucose-1-phosphate cytidylyltransferase